MDLFGKKKIAKLTRELDDVYFELKTLKHLQDERSRETRLGPQCKICAHGLYVDDTHVACGKAIPCRSFERKE